MKNKLEEYKKDVDDIFAEAKTSVNYNFFMKTVKKVYGEELDLRQVKAKETLDFIYDQVDDEYLLTHIMQMQLLVQEMLEDIKIINDRRVKFVMDWNPGSEVDSTLASKADLEAFDRDFR